MSLAVPNAQSYSCRLVKRVTALCTAAGDTKPDENVWNFHPMSGLQLLFNPGARPPEAAVVEPTPFLVEAACEFGGS